jgi:hypothetical protein
MMSANFFITSLPTAFLLLQGCTRNSLFTLFRIFNSEKAARDAKYSLNSTHRSSLQSFRHALAY